MNREVLHQALDALKSLDDTLLFTDWENGEGEDIGPQLRDSVRSLRAELAKPEPEDAEPEKFWEFSSDLPIRNATPTAPE